MDDVNLLAASIVQYEKLIEHGNVYECAAYIRENYDGMPDHILEPLLFRLLDALLPEQATHIGFPPEEEPAAYGRS